MRQATNSLRQQRIEQRRRVRAEQERLTETVRQLLVGIINLTLPEARQLVLKTTPTREHWAGAVLTLAVVTDDQGQELAWRQLLSADDIALIDELQVELTECYAIPNDEVTVTWLC